MCADRLELMSGDVFSGKILRLNDQEVSIQLYSGGIMSFRLSGVRSVRQVSRSGDVSRVLFERSSRRGPLSLTPEPAPDPSGALPLPARLPGTGPAEGTGGSGAETTPDPPPSAGSEESPTPGTTTPAGRRSEDELEDPDYGYSLFPPRDFVAWQEAASDNLRAYKDPITLTSFTIATYPSADAVKKIVDNAVRTYSERYSTFHVVRNDELDVPGARKERAARILEVEGRIGSIAVRQLQLFATNRDGTIVLTYSATNENYPRFSVLFEESIRSFRLKGHREDDGELEPVLPLYPPVLRSDPTPR